ncbi:MAG: poly-beta-1,6-N-acetyl-D-glucosamine N-deacetylase PgaB [Deltaproteobacteria bacterium]
MNFMPLLLQIILISLLAVPAAFASEDASAIRAAQIFYTKAASFDELREEIRRMKQSGINTVIFRVFGNRGDRIHKLAGDNPESRAGVYYATAHSPVIADILGEAARAARLEGVSIFAWMTTRRAVYGADESLMDAEFSLAKGEESTIERLDLFNPKAVKRLESLYRDLAKYDIDGVLFQDDFIIKHMEGFGASAKLQYLLDFNTRLEAADMYSEVELRPNGRVERIRYTEAFDRWARWKNGRLRQVASRLVGTVKSENPKLTTVFNAYYELFHNTYNNLIWQSHDIQLAKEFDLVAVMAYQRQMMEELGVDSSEVIEIIRGITRKSIAELGSPKRAIVKMQMIDWNDKKPVPSAEALEIYRAIAAVSDAVGVAFVPWEGDLDIKIAGDEGAENELQTLSPI